MSTSSKSPAGIDPRGPRFGAGITAVLLLVTIALGLGTAASGATLGDRALQPAFLLLAAITAVFAWGAFAGVARHPYGALFKALIRPRLEDPAYLEEPEPPAFAQLVGFLVSITGVVLHLLGVPFGLVGAAAVAFIAAFLNSVFGLCLGCEMYSLLVRAKIIRSA
ncbi:MAG TPA: DUF4395 domain-containing protein [Pontimonas sp.]|nr:DUF4395 domain-containing protein [Pontimonas sp.]